MKKRYLLATWEGGGNLPPELGIARRLVSRGHEVRVLGDPSIEASARAVGCTFSAWVRPPHKNTLLPEDDFLRDWEYKNVLKVFARFLDIFVCGPVQKFVDDTTEVLERHPVDVILADMLMFGPMMIAESRKIPCAALVPNIYMRPTKTFPPLGPGFMPATNPFAHLRDAFMRWMSTRLWKRGLPPMNEARGRLGLEPLTDMWTQYDRIERVLVLTARAFDFGDAKMLPKNVTYTGPILDDPEWAGSEWTSPWPADSAHAKDPLVLVGLSSTFQDQAAVIGRVIEALAKMPVRALVTLGPALDNVDVTSSAPNVVCVRTAPHALVLPHASAVVTHCGHGTSIRALAAGKPMVCIPMGRDQNDTAARIVARSAGVRLSVDASVEKIRSAVETVLHDPKLTEGAKRLQRAILAETKAFDVAAEIEKLGGDRLEPRHRRPLSQPSDPPMAEMR